MEKKICKVCGKTFSVYPYRTITAKFCSYKCAGKFKETKLKRVCRVCGKLFYTRPSQLKYYAGAGKYCSMTCAYGGITREAAKRPAAHYGSRKADKQWQRAVREKDKSICQRCGKYEKYIHTHHVATRARRPDLKFVVSNGICLCNSCHAWVHHNIAEATRLGFLSTEKYELKNPIMPLDRE